MKPEWGTQRMLNCFATPEDLSAGGMKALLVNQIVDGRALDKGGVELDQWLRPKHPAIQVRRDELLNFWIMHLQKPFYVGAVIPDQVIPIAEDVHGISFAVFHIVWH
jgi:hypothetical protein